MIQKWLPIDAALAGAVGDYVEQCADQGYAAFLLPHPVNEGGGGLKDILAQRVLPIDVDHGDISAKVQAITAALGEPWLTVNSGGVENGQNKVHLYYRLPTDATPEQFAELAVARATAAQRFGADTKVGKNPAQILRIPGSRHGKGTPRLCTLERILPESTVAIGRLIGAGVSKSTTDGASYLDFNNVAPFPGVDMDRVLTQPILAEGKSPDGLTRYEGGGSAIGHYLRNMRDPAVKWGEEEAWQAAQDWNAAINTPAWGEQTLRQHFQRLLRIDRENNGPIAPPAGGPLKLCEWSMAEYAGTAPIQKWLVPGTFPLGEPGIIAGDGGIGKSFLTLDLCFRVAMAKRPANNHLVPTGSELFGAEIAEPGSAVFITAEESKAALHRRIEALDKHGLRSVLRDRLCVVSLRDLGGGQSFIGRRELGYPMTDYAHAVLAELKTKPDLRLAVLDPVSVFYGGEGNDRTAVQAFANVLSHMASETGATIIALHHMRKDSEGTGSGRKNILGSGGFVDAFRFAYTLQRLPKKDEAKIAADYGLDKDHGELVVGELVKANGSPEGAEHIYERTTNGVLRQLPQRIDIALAEQARRRGLLVEAVAWYAEYSQPFTKTGKGSGLYSNRQSLPEDLRTLSQRQLEALADEALGAGELQVAAAGGEKRQCWLCTPLSSVASGLLRSFTPGARPAWEARDLA